MAKLDIAIDLGTAYTSIFVSGNGIVLREPSVIAYYDNGGKRNLRAVGSAAYAMIGKAPEKTRVVFPIIDGVIRDPDGAAAMLSEFIKMILPGSYIIKPKLRAILSVPIGLTVEERKMYEEVLMRSLVDEIIMVNSVMLAAVGTELPVSSEFGGFIASIGAGVSEFAAIGSSGIVSGNSINIGGDMIDRTIADNLRGKYRIKVNPATVRKVKDNIASLIRNDCATAQIAGLDVETKTVRTQVVSADKMYGAISVYYENITAAISNIINASKPAVAEEIQKNGITVVGGGARIPGLATVMENALEIKVHIPDEPQYAVISGAGMLISDPYKLEDIIVHA